MAEPLLLPRRAAPDLTVVRVVHQAATPDLAMTKGAANTIYPIASDAAIYSNPPQIAYCWPAVQATMSHIKQY